MVMGRNGHGPMGRNGHGPAEMVMGRFGYGPIWLWAEMTLNQQCYWYGLRVSYEQSHMTQQCRFTGNKVLKTAQCEYRSFLPLSVSSILYYHVAF